MTYSGSIFQLKADLRSEALGRRDALPAPMRQAAAETIAARPFPVAVAPGIIVSGFMPLGGEINPLPLMRKLVEQGARLALPVVARRGEPLVMRAWAWGDPLAAGIWGIREPLREAPEVEPDILLVPLLAFDRLGHRLGYGGGYYDRTIARLRATKPVIAAGLAYSVQERTDLPVTSHDAQLDLVLTEREIVDLRDS